MPSSRSLENWKRKHEEVLRNSTNLENQMNTRIEQLEKENQGLLTNIDNLNNAVTEKAASWRD